MINGMGEGSGAGAPIPGREEHQARKITRRVVLRDGSAVAIAVMLAGPASSLGDVAVKVKPGRPAFLSTEELRTLRALVDRFIPGRPEDSHDGGAAAGCAEAIDALLGAFRFRRPRIYAGGPFSDRGGSPVNHFKKFLRLDPYEERAWRLRIEGSRRRKRHEFNGPITGWQQTYREGLRALDEAAGEGRSFDEVPPAGQDLILRNAGKPIADLVDIAFPHTVQFMYGAPEYGGNRGLVAWRYSNYDGDVHPRGYTPEEIENPGGSSSRDTMSAITGETTLAELSAIAPLAAPEAAHHIVARDGHSLAALRSELERVTEWARRGGLDGA